LRTGTNLMLTPWGDFAVADAHVHFFSRKFFSALGSQAGKTAEQVAETAGWVLPADDPAELARSWVAELDAQGVTRAALIASIPGDESSVESAVAEFPQRFFGFFMVNPLEEGAVERVRIALRCGLHAVCLFPGMHRYPVSDPRAEAVLQAAASFDRRAVFVHCGVLTVGIRKKLGLGSPFDMRFANPLELHGPALRYPGLKFVVPHFGAGYLREALMLADLCPNVYLDTSSSNSWMRYEGLDLKTVFRRALDVVGAQRLLFGTDSSYFPRGWNYAIFEAQTRAMLDLGISSADARLIIGENLPPMFAG
ncbi:MAG: amidohydrolase family protein, partial [Candidatus Solibacter sp.]|nr:amidohydrolase family protein [Candidatus Solibacter sp.]